MPAEKLLFLTGHLALPRLEKLLGDLGQTDFEWAIHDIGVKVAALMTGEIILRRLKKPVIADRIIVPGRCRADLDALSRHFEVRFDRGPDELVDLPAFLGRKGAPPDLSRQDMRIFAEIVDASALTAGEIAARAVGMQAAGADVIDLGCLPDTPFPHLEETIAELKRHGLRVSVDSASRGELTRATKAGADYLLSLNEETLDIAGLGDAVPILVPAVPHDMASLDRAIARAREMGIAFVADPILDPIHYGFSASLVRYHQLRERHPEIEMLMGTGNLTELTDADTSGVTAMLLGVASELYIRNLLVVHVSPHTRRTIEEHDAARRMMYAARADSALPRGYSSRLLQVHDTKPFASTPDELFAQGAEVRDRNFRIETAVDGIHVYNRDVHHVETDAFEFYPKLGVEDDAAHAFYLGAELQKAEIAWRIGKRYAQDVALDFGVAAPRPDGDRTRLEAAGHTLKPKTGEAGARPAGEVGETGKAGVSGEAGEAGEPDGARLEMPAEAREND